MTAAGRIYVPAAGITALECTSATTSPSLLWESNKLALGNASPIVHGGRVYALDKAGVLNCGDDKDGRVAWELRLKGTFWATPLIAGDHLYAANADGDCLVVRLGKRGGDIVHTADLGEGFFGSPAADATGLYLRGDKHLWKIAE